MLQKVWQRISESDAKEATHTTPSRVAPEYETYLTLGPVVDDCRDELTETLLQLQDEAVAPVPVQYALDDAEEYQSFANARPPLATENDRQLLSVVVSRTRMTVFLRKQFQARQAARYAAAQQWNFASSPLEGEGEAA